MHDACAAAGIRRPGTSVYREQWLEVAREALSGVPDAALRTNKGSYRWNITESGGQIKVGTPGVLSVRRHVGAPGPQTKS